MDQKRVSFTMRMFGGMDEVVLIQYQTGPDLGAYAFNKRKEWRTDTIQNVVHRQWQWAI